MDIDRIVIPARIRDKLARKHSVRSDETHDVLLSGPRIRFAERGHIPGEDVYAAFGRTYAGRYLVVYFVYKPDARTAIVISARDMTRREKRTYGRK